MAHGEDHELVEPVVLSGRRLEDGRGMEIVLGGFGVLPGVDPFHHFLRAMAHAPVGHEAVVAVVRPEHDPHVLHQHAVTPHDDLIASAREDPPLDPGALEGTVADADHAAVPSIGFSDPVRLLHLLRHPEEQLESRLRQGFDTGKDPSLGLQDALL